MTASLNPFQLWMVDRNVEATQTEGLDVVVARLRAQGYHRVATAVEKEVRP